MLNQLWRYSRLSSAAAPFFMGEARERTVLLSHSFSSLPVSPLAVILRIRNISVKILPMKNAEDKGEKWMTAKYAYNPRDAKFILTEWLPVEEIFSYERFQAYSKEDIDLILEQAHRMVRDIVAPTNDIGEEHVPRLENGRIIGPPTWGEVFRYYQQNGWGTSNFDEDNEAPLPEVLYSVVAEMTCAASPAWVYYPALTTGAAKVIQTFGDEDLKKRFLPKMMDGSWQGCMCITEPAAGTDVGDTLTRAYPTEEEGIYKIKGSKIFISAGDGDHVDNFIYLTLARVEGAQPGTRGLSLFVVPRFWINEDGSYTDNDVVTTGKEDKLGIRGCPAVSLAYGDNDNCRGYIVGNPPDETGVGEGMKQMFQMMNGKRIESGLTSTGITSNEYHNVAEYARERIQGRPLTDPTGERVPIIEHEDIKRALLLNKATTEACRAMVTTAYFYMDISEHDPDPQRRKWAADRVACLTPVCKAYPSDEAWTLLCETIQTYGGYGFTEAYPAARAARDCKINSIYEGTNYIQSMDLIGRKWIMQNGQAFADLLQEIETFIRNNKAKMLDFSQEFTFLERALQAYRFMQSTTAKWAREGKFNLVPCYSRRILTATGQLLGAYFLLDQALISWQRLQELEESHFDYYFYLGKVISARFYVRQILPHVWYLADLLAEEDSTIIDAPLAIFAF